MKMPTGPGNAEYSNDEHGGTGHERSVSLPQHYFDSVFRQTLFFPSV